MPHKPAKPCANRSCPGRAVPGSRYCAEHQPEQARPRDRRPSASARGYDRKWRAIRARYLRAHPDCVVCGERATDVDHILALKDGGTHAWDNLQGLCKLHHSQKTALVDGGFGNQTFEEKLRGGGM